MFSNEKNYSIHSALQFLSQCTYFRDVIMDIKVSQDSLFLAELLKVIVGLYEAKYRAINVDVTI